MRDRLYRFYWWLEKKIVPGNTSTQNIYYRELKRVWPEHPVWLDLGCGHQLFAEWMTAEQAEMAQHSKRLIGIDLDQAGLTKHIALHDRVQGDLERLPFRDGAFSLVTANMVLEHLRDPAHVFQEIGRILQPGGLFVFHTPNYLNFKVFAASLIPGSVKNRLIRLLDERQEEDVFKTYYRINTPARARGLSLQAGFQLASLTLTDGSAFTIMLGPLVIPELLLMRLCRLDALKNLRSNIIAVLRKP